MKYNTANVPSFDMRLDGTELSEEDIKDFDKLKESFGLQEQASHYKMALPTAISIQADWRINKYLYLGLNPYFALRQKKGNNVGTHYMTSINVSPRFEMAGVGVGLPITYNQFKSFNVGLGLRLGALWLGSTNFFNMIASNKLREANLCIAFKVSIHHKE